MTMEVLWGMREGSIEIVVQGSVKVLDFCSGYLIVRAQIDPGYVKMGINSPALRVQVAVWYKLD